MKDTTLLAKALTDAGIAFEVPLEGDGLFVFPLSHDEALPVIRVRHAAIPPTYISEVEKDGLPDPDYKMRGDHSPENFIETLTGLVRLIHRAEFRRNLGHV